MPEKNTILLVDDSEDDRALMRMALKMAKCKVALYEARDGEEAIAYLSGHSIYSDRNKFPLPTVMLLDLNMPKKDGFDVLTWVRGRVGLSRLSITILTASMRREDLERSFDLGATSYLVKPSSLDALSAMMKCFCEWIQMNHFPSLEGE